MINKFFLFFLSGCLFFCAPQNTSAKHPYFGNVDSITKEKLHEYLSFIASDSMQGRDTPSQGLDHAANYISKHLSKWKLKGAGDYSVSDSVNYHKTYFQNIALLRSKLIPEKTSISINGITFSFGEDFLSTPVASSVTAPLVYVKNGYIIKEQNINPYAHIDVHGKIMVVLGGFPKSVTFSDLVGKRGIDYDTPQNYGMNHGAVAVIVIPSIRALENWENGKYNAVRKGDVTVLKFAETEPASIPLITASEKFINTLFVKENIPVNSMWNRSFADSIDSFDFSPVTKVTLNISTIIDTPHTQNIVAILEGTDSLLKNEYVAFTAHYDHVGMGLPKESDSIYNGADDNGSGTVGLLACAEAFATGPKPKRSVLFIWHAAEEKGLLGSKYFTQYPTISLSNIIALQNLDMIGRSKPDSGFGSDDDNVASKNEVFVIGPHMMSEQLQSISEEVNNSYLHLSFNYKFDNPLHPFKLFYRSDQYNYAKNNIPVLFYFDGLHLDYHKVSDEIEKIDFNKLLQITQTAFAVGWQLTYIPKRPVISIENLFE